MYYNNRYNKKEENPHITVHEADGLANRPYKVRYYQGSTGVIGIVERPEEKDLRPADLISIAMKRLNRR